LVVYINGACRNNGTSTARASYGVNFGPNSPYNTQGLLPSSLPQTSTRAETEALVQATQIVQNITDRDLRFRPITIATDSDFLVDAMCLWLHHWIEDGGVESRGEKVAHCEVLKQVQEKLDYIEEYSDQLQGIRSVMFWHISREMNREADSLANRALDGI
jgi:ribonuclease HI